MYLIWPLCERSAGILYTILVTLVWTLYRFVDFNSIKIIIFSFILFAFDVLDSRKCHWALRPFPSLSVNIFLRMLLSFKFKKEKIFWPFRFRFFQFQMNRICCSYLSRIPFEIIDLRKSFTIEQSSILFNRRENPWVFLLRVTQDDSFETNVRNEKWKGKIVFGK